ncbi:MAG: L-ribulose-5-phosphate 4-epimerase [bacterium]|jgi:L-ribulose-5-phosphate 4-epimerase|nr:L-ribulose-5-phosphate 4-epimerase [candidate division KSB1 bacterium]MDH7560611.1 L-ribulose-5-phosphate 4-epimerase [bacterium]
MLGELKEEVLKANLALREYGLVTLTWGNVSGRDREKNLVVIKPSGIDYSQLSPDDMVVVDLDGKVVEGQWQPSSDTATHVALYQAFRSIGGIAHTHSDYATSFAQACLPIPCLGTTHADHFHGPIPVTRFLTADEVEREYERATGLAIVEAFAQIAPLEMPAVLVAGHGPFTWGENPMEAVNNSLVLERVAQMAFHTILLNARVGNLPDHILHKHFQRKHGPEAYYGQKKAREG